MHTVVSTYTLCMCIPMKRIMTTTREHDLPSSFQVHAIVEHPLTPVCLGAIRCCALGRDPVRFEWTGPKGGNLELDSTGSEARGLAAGQYTIRATDADGAQTTLRVDLRARLVDSLVVTEYEVDDSTSAHAHDGNVRAFGHGLDAWSSYLWSNGTRTTEPVLMDVPPGHYSVTPLPVAQECPQMLHACPPAHVNIVSLI